MKAVRLYQFLFLTSQLFLISSHKVELPQEPNPKWDIDFNDMLEFQKSFKGQDVGNQERNNFVEDQLSLITDHLTLMKKLDVVQNQAKQYIRRYINLFLVKCNLKDMPESDQDIKLDLEFFITKEDLLFLQSLSKESSTLNVHDSLQRLDSIFDRGLQVKVESLYETSWSFLHSLMEFISIPPSLYYSKIFYYFVVLAVTLLLLIILRLSDISNVAIMFMVVNNLIILEGILDYLNALNEAEVEDNVMLMRALENRAACDPSKQTYWYKIVGLFLEDECLNYHKTFVKSKVKEVSPLKYILDAYNIYLFQYPVMITGSCIRVFTTSLYDSSNWFLKDFLVVINYVWLIPLLAIMVLCLMKPRIRFSFFGVGLDIIYADRGITHLRNKSEVIEDRRIQEIGDSESRDVTTATVNETDLEIKGDETVGGSCSKLAEKSGDIEIVTENREPRLALLDDITTAKEIVNDIMKNE